MSKLFKNYLALKAGNPNKFYLFKCGIFYIFLDDDAKKMSTVLGLKLSNLTADVVKCGFPVNSLDRYIERLKDTQYDIDIVDDNTAYCPTSMYDYSDNKLFQKTLDDFLAIDIDSVSISQAFDLLYDLQDKFNKVKTEVSNEKKKISL